MSVIHTHNPIVVNVFVVEESCLVIFSCAAIIIFIHHEGKWRGKCTNITQVKGHEMQQ